MGLVKIRVNLDCTINGQDITATTIINQQDLLYEYTYNIN